MEALSRRARLDVLAEKTAEELNAVSDDDERDLLFDRFGEMLGAGLEEGARVRRAERGTVRLLRDIAHIDRVMG